MRINEILSEIDLNRRQFIRNLASVAGAVGNVNLLPASSKIDWNAVEETARNISFTSDDPYDMIKQLINTKSFGFEAAAYFKRAADAGGDDARHEGGLNTGIFPGLEEKLNEIDVILREKGIEGWDWADTSVSDSLFPSQKMDEIFFGDNEPPTSVLRVRQEDTAENLTWIEYLEEFQSYENNIDDYKRLLDNIEEKGYDTSKLRLQLQQEEKFLEQNALTHEQYNDKRIDEIIKKFQARRDQISWRVQERINKKIQRFEEARPKILERIKKKLEKIYKFLNSRKTYTPNQQYQEKYKATLKFKYNSLYSQYKDLFEQTIDPYNQSVKELEAKVNAVLVSLRATKNIGLDLMERRKKQRG